MTRNWRYFPALVKLDKPQAFESLRLALTAPDYLVRKHAANLIKQNDLTKDFSNIEKMVGTVKPYDVKTKTQLEQILNTEADYRRAVSRKNGTVKAILTTEKGTFTIEFLPEAAPLTVDNFIKLAKSNYFNNVVGAPRRGKFRDAGRRPARRRQRRSGLVDS